MSDHPIPSIAPNTGVVLCQNGSACRIAHPISSRLQIHLHLMYAPRYPPAAGLRQNPSDPPLQCSAVFLAYPGRFSPAKSWIYVPKGIVGTAYPRSPTVPRASRKVPSPGMAYAAYVPAFGHIFLSPDPNRVTLAIQRRSHAIRLQCCVDWPDLRSQSVDDR